MAYAMAAACASIAAAHKRYGIQFICQDETLEIAMGEAFYSDLCKEDIAVEQAGNVLGVPVYVCADTDGVVVRKRGAAQ